MNNSGCLSLRFRKDDIDKILARRHNLNGLEIIQDHCGRLPSVLPDERSSNGECCELQRSLMIGLEVREELVLERALVGIHYTARKISGAKPRVHLGGT